MGEITLGRWLAAGDQIALRAPDLEPVTDDAGNELMNPSTGEPLLKNDEGDIYIERDGKWIQLMDKDGDLVPTEPEQPSLHANIRKDLTYAPSRCRSRSSASRAR